jgi:hypothetical protein
VWYRFASGLLDIEEDDSDPQWLKEQRARERQSNEYLRSLAARPEHEYHARLMDEGYEEPISFDVDEKNPANAYWVTPDGRTFSVPNHWDSARWILGLPNDGRGGYSYQPNITKHTLMKLARLLRVQTDRRELASEMVGHPTDQQLQLLRDTEERLRAENPRGARVTHEVNHAPEDRFGTAHSGQELEMLLDRLRKGKRRNFLPEGVYFEPPQ